MENVTEKINADAIQRLLEELSVQVSINEQLKKKVEALNLQSWNQKDEHERQVKKQIAELFLKLSNPLSFAAEIIESIEDYTPAEYKVAKNRLKEHFEIEEMKDDAQEIVGSLNVMGLSDEVAAILNEKFDLEEHLERLDRYETLDAIDVLTNSLRNKY